ncbi:MAG: hypothetical protein JJ902_02680 [Roseibium sp.]|nr:hypothetical protein [Roseibium sp.]
MVTAGHISQGARACADLKDVDDAMDNDPSDRGSSDNTNAETGDVPTTGARSRAPAAPGPKDGWDPSQGERRDYRTRPWSGTPTGQHHAGTQEYPSATEHATKHDIREALDSVLTSPEFRSVPQLRAFLSFVVEAVLEDHPDKIKGYTIAVEALGRNSTFNPATDPIVRVEAARLRRRLDDYYTGSGADVPLKIGIPKGRYTPVFVFAAAQSPTANETTVDLADVPHIGPAAVASASDVAPIADNLVPLPAPNAPDTLKSSTGSTEWGALSRRPLWPVIGAHASLWIAGACLLGFAAGFLVGRM